MTQLRLLLLLVLMLLFSCKKEDNTDATNRKETSVNTTQKEAPVFERISAEQSGIEFINTVKANVATKENLFDYDYFYNGAGVGLADINNDGLLDIFFAGNQVANKLYLNKGNLVFEDISEQAGINQNKQWSNGVTFADVNNDGWLDIYVTQAGPNERANRKNLLYINQKDLSFKERAEEMGLADTGVSTQAAFFDFDKDGDLDCVVSNENELYGTDPVNFNRILGQNKDLLKQSSIQLYENLGGKFNKITEKAGLLKPAFGLGLAVSDINNDGWLDIYIANDYYVPDAMYINNKNGTFTDKIKESTKQVSFYGMGVDIADINNDARQDIYVLDMASNDHFRAKTLMASMDVPRFELLTDRLNYQSQYMFNSLQLNIGNDRFNNIAQLAKLSKTDWSWAGLIVDLNNNGSKEIYVTNGYRRYALDNDLQNKVRAAQNQYRGQVPLEVKQQLYSEMPSEKLSNILFQAKEELLFKDQTYNWGLNDPSYSNGAAYGDLDNDGDLELVVNNIDDKAFLYKNLSSENQRGNYLKVDLEGANSEPFAKVTLRYQGNTQFVEAKRVRGYLSSVPNSAHFGLGTTTTIDTVRVEWLDGRIEEKYQVAANSEITFSQEQAIAKKSEGSDLKGFQKIDPSTLGINYIHRENDYNDFADEVLLPYKQSTLGPAMAIGDINGDQLEDLYLGGASGQAGKLYIQTASGFKEINPGAIKEDKMSEDMAAVFIDSDGDGDQDLFVVSGGNEFEAYSANYVDRLYLNDGSGNFSKSASTNFSNDRFSGKTVSTIDYDQDGDLDLIVGNRMIPKNYPKPSISFIYRNDKGNFTNVTEEVAPGFMTFGIINEVITTDFDNDGWQDFIAVGDWSAIGLFKNTDGVFKNIAEKSKLDEEKGWWFSVAATDVNKDGYHDYLIGNVGLNIKFKASKEEPFKVFANDFDNNGTNDVVLSSQYQGEYVPVRGKECSTQQMPFISEKYKTYTEFAEASLVDIYGDGLETGYKAEATQFKSLLLINNKDGTFTKQVLPTLAQSNPILSMASTDLNKDGYEDVILSGDIYETEVETPRLDNISGMVLMADAKGGYTLSDQASSGLYIEGNVKKIAMLSHKGLNKKLLIAAVNNDRLALFEVKEY